MDDNFDFEYYAQLFDTMFKDDLEELYTKDTKDQCIDIDFNISVDSVDTDINNNNNNDIAYNTDNGNTNCNQLLEIHNLIDFDSTFDNFDFDSTFDNFDFDSVFDKELNSQSLLHPEENLLFTPQKPKDGDLFLVSPFLVSNKIKKTKKNVRFDPYTKEHSNTKKCKRTKKCKKGSNSNSQRTKKARKCKI